VLDVARFAITLPDTHEFFPTPFSHAVALSPQGTHFVYAVRTGLNLRRLDQLEPTPIQGTGGVGQSFAREPFFSPDGQWIGFWQSGEIRKVADQGRRNTSVDRTNSCRAELARRAAAARAHELSLRAP